MRGVTHPVWRGDVSDFSDGLPLPCFQHFGRRHLEGGHARVITLKTRGSVFDFRDVWTEAAKAMQGRLAEKSLTLTQNIADERFVIVADREKLALMLDEITALAVRLANDGGTITAQLAHGRDGEISFKLQEKGASIPSDVLCKIFDRPFNSIRKPAAAPGSDSSAINLSSVYDIIGMHGGRIFVNSTGGHGATFLFTLPVVTAGEDNSHEQAVHSGRRRR